MFNKFKTLVVCAGLLAGLLAANPVLAAKPKAEAAPAAAAAPTAATAPAEVASAPVAAPAAAAAPAEENPYGLSALWSQGDGVAKGTLLILVLMSMGSWYVIITKFAEQSVVSYQTRNGDLIIGAQKGHKAVCHAPK